MGRLVKIGAAAKLLGVGTTTLRRWEQLGKYLPESHNKGETRFYDTAKLIDFKTNKNNLTYLYARVSSYDQRKDLETQVELLESYSASHGWCYEVIRDLGSGLNYKKKGLKQLVNAILNGKINRLVITHKDRLLRFGSELIFSLCEAKDIEVVIINKGAPTSFEEELTKDVLEIITVFSARLYGSRSHKNKKLISVIKETIK